MNRPTELLDALGCWVATHMRSVLACAAALILTGAAYLTLDGSAPATRPGPDGGGGPARSPADRPISVRPGVIAPMKLTATGACAKDETSFRAFITANRALEVAATKVLSDEASTLRQAMTRDCSLAENDAFYSLVLSSWYARAAATASG